MLADYRTRHPDGTIVLSAITPQSRNSFEGASYVTSFFCEAVYRSTGTAMRLIRAIGVLFSAALFLLLYRLGIRAYGVGGKRLSPFYRALAECDQVVGVGGGYLLSKPGFSSLVSLLITLFEFRYAQILGKPVDLYSMSIGPFTHRWHGVLVARMLNRCRRITIREELSRTCLKDSGVSGPEVRKALDAAFYFQTDQTKAMRNFLMKKGIFFTRPVLGITVRRCFADEHQAHFEQAFACCAQFTASELGWKVVFIPQVTAADQNDDDREVYKRIAGHLKPHRNIVFLRDAFSYKEVKGIYENLSYLIGTRMHSVIFSLTAGVPSIAIAYEPKTLGIMTWLGLQKWVLMKEEVTADRLIGKLRQLLRSEGAYRSYLREDPPWMNGVYGR
ncbi:MAG: polysaccharide pyruvyl transferase family protein [Patescibacteria group bacterium]|nr:polysaccharide pyruvyl transferase family protein [Patescibacteria group bacterium]